MFKSSKYQGQVIWITGASSGLGRELAISLAKENVKLILSSRQDDKLKETQKLAGLNDDNCLVLPLDLTQIKDDQIDMILDRIVLKFGNLDILIHNASLSQRSFAHKTVDLVVRKIMETNFFAPVRLTKCALPTLLKSNNPRVIIISSMAGKLGVPLRSAYCAAKHALHGFFEAMQLELHGKVKFSFFVLGGLKTDSVKHALTEDGSINVQPDIWHHRNMLPADCAKKIISKIHKKKTEHVIGGFEKMGLLLDKISPTLHRKLMLKFFSKELRHHK